MSDEDTLPPGWWMSDRGPVSPNGRLYDVIPQGYELADLAAFDALLDETLAKMVANVPDLAPFEHDPG